MKVLNINYQQENYRRNKFKQNAVKNNAGSNTSDAYPNLNLFPSNITFNKNIPFGTNIIAAVDRIAKTTDAKKDAIESLQEYIALIRDEKLRNLCNKVLEDTDDSFFIVPSSTTLKYHNKEDNKIGGIVTHQKRSTVVALSALSRYGYDYSLEKNDDEKKIVDLAITAALIHDCPYRLIKDKGRYFTSFDHAVNNAKYLQKTMEEMNFEKKDTDLLCSAVGFHMGIGDRHEDKSWVDNFSSFQSHPLIKVVQEADYYSTRKNSPVDYSLDNIDIKKKFIK